MSALARYAYLRTRVSLMAGRLLPQDRLEALIAEPVGEPDDVQRAARQLGLDPTEPAVAGSTLEQRLVSAFLNDFVILVRPLHGAARELLLYWAHRVELANLKAVITGKLAGQPAAAIRKELLDMGPFAALPVDDLLRTEDMAELLRRLDTTPYSDIARQARRVFEEQHDAFALDAAIDRRYFTGLARRAKALREAGAAEVRHLVGTLVDRTNLVWLLRYRYAYHLGPAQSYYLLIPDTYRLSGSQLMALAQLPSLEQVIARLPDPYGPWLRSALTSFDVVRILDAETWRFAETQVRRNAPGLAAAFAYLLLRERDLRQMRAIVKGKRLKFAPDLIRTATGAAGSAPAPA
ncbi:MAG TPA: V-type ATPase subunit [Burkholderiales bacterium]|nr:V-type ATPase subunit [Burkholderiales bacterium]